MKKLSRQEKILVIVTAVLVVFYGYYRLFYSPFQSRYTVVKQQVDKARDTVDNINLVSASNKKQKEQLTKLQASYEETAKALPTSERNPEITYDIKRLADSSKVTINTITLGKGILYNQTANTNNDSAQNTTVNGRLMTIPVSLGISGDYLTIMDFIAAIENDKRIAEVNTINISAKSGAIFQANITANYYYLEFNSSEETKYDFNKGSYGKDNLFK
jgi:Tfp pilus assembly protein PilO